LVKVRLAQAREVELEVAHVGLEVFARFARLVAVVDDAEEVHVVWDARQRRGCRRGGRGGCGTRGCPADRHAHERVTRLIEQLAAVEL
jgi:hypothetical protein